MKVIGNPKKHNKRTKRIFKNMFSNKPCRYVVNGILEVIQNLTACV